MPYLNYHGLTTFKNCLETKGKVHEATVAQTLAGGGTSSQIILGDGTVQDISEFIANNIEIIREQLGIYTEDKDGLVPKTGAV